MHARNSRTYLRFCVVVRLRGCARPRSSPPAQGSSRRAPSCAPTGEPTLSGAPLSPCFAAESAREGTLMSLPEGAPARSGHGAESGYSKYTFGKRGHPLSQRGKAVSSVVTSGCPKRSEGGFPVGTRTITAFPSGAKLSTAFSSGTVHPPPSQVPQPFQAEPNGRNEPSGPPPARTCPSRPAHPAEHAGRRHRSSPRRVRVRRLHARRRQPRG